MVKVQIEKSGPVAAESPSQAIVKAANEVITVTDGKGRAIGIKRLGPVERLRMLKLIGGTNEHYMGMASLAFLVSTIDGEPIIKPANDLQLEALIQRLGDEGVEAVAAAAAQHFSGEDLGDKAAIKNS